MKYVTSIIQIKKYFYSIRYVIQIDFPRDFERSRKDPKLF